MGREKKILLTMLCLLSGTFVGVLSAKLLVPRPPAGAGPDVHAEAVAAPAHEIVEPPSLSERPAASLVARVDPDGRLPAPSAFAAGAEPVEDAPAETSRFAAAAEPAAVDAVEPSGDLDDAVPSALIEPSSPPPRRDPFVTRAALDEPAEPPAPMNETFSRALPEPPAPVPAGVPAGAYVTVVGDSWWSLAERAYGDGRLYRALFAWNRAIDPRVSLVPGTRLDVPPRQRLEASSPNLIPDR